MHKPGSIRAMISSTAVDLPVHRREALEACLREGVFPVAMEHLPASDIDAVSTSLRMVDDAEVYIGIYGWRYGHVPKDSEISITEMELNRAIERKIPVLVFLIHDDHALTRDMVEADKDAQDKLAALKKRASQNRIKQSFRSAEELRSLVIQSLSKLVTRAESLGSDRESRDSSSTKLSQKLPQPPSAFVAHPYALLETSEVIGRENELKILDDWLTDSAIVPHYIRIVSFVAIGGMGKSALTWKWFHSNAPHIAPWIKGRIWWSFYESDAHFENFVVRTLAYVLAKDESETREIPFDEAQELLITILTDRSFLIVFDGLERVLMAYARMDAAHLDDDDLDDKTANQGHIFRGIPEEAHETYMAKHRLRIASDPRIGRFLARLASAQSKSRVLISTRLYPADLQTRTGKPLPGCYHIFLSGLSDEDALNLWDRYGVSGSAEELLPLFNAFGNYPLLLRALAGEVSEYRPAPFNFTRWKADHPDFNPAGLPLVNAKTHVLQYALSGLENIQSKTLHTLAAFRMPIGWDVLKDLLVGPKKTCASEVVLDTTLTELEDRGLVGWEKMSNRYDLHPIVRAVVWHALESPEREGIFQELHSYFAAAPKENAEDENQGNDDLTPAVEMYHALLGLNRYSEAWHVFYERLDRPTLARIGATRIRYELLSQFVHDEDSDFAWMRPQDLLKGALELLADTCIAFGLPGAAIQHLERASSISELSHSSLKTFSIAYWLVGHPFDSLRTALSFLQSIRSAEDLAGQCIAYSRLAELYAKLQLDEQSKLALARAQKIADWQKTAKTQSQVFLARSVCALEKGIFDKCLHYGRIAFAIANENSLQREELKAKALLAEAQRANHDQATIAQLEEVISISRSCSDVEAELAGTLGLVELMLAAKQYEPARALLEQIQAVVVKGPYTEYAARMGRLFCLLFSATQNSEEAIKAAQNAFKNAWCDGPPFAYNVELDRLYTLTTSLGIECPSLPSFSYDDHVPLPNVPLNPSGKFKV